MPADTAGITGDFLFERRDAAGNLLETARGHNIVTDIGNQLYGEHGAGVGSTVAVPTGMRLGTGAVTGANTPANTGTGAALAAYLPGSGLALDASYPQSTQPAGPGTARVITYKCTYQAGEGTSAVPITEAVIVNDNITVDSASAAANTIARVAVAGISAKGPSDTLTASWQHSLLGS